jgi:integrase
MPKRTRKHLVRKTVLRLSILLGCGLRRAELSALRREDIQIRQGIDSLRPEVNSREHLATLLVSGVDNALRLSAHLFRALFRKESSR